MSFILSPAQIAFNARGDGKFNKPFEEQLAFVRQKLNLPTEYYDDIIKAAHDRAFIVAGAAKADLLTDLRLAVEQSIADGKSIQWFRNEFDAIVQKHGWEGWTGSGSKVGRDWRTRIIYNTNLSASYAAGRWQQLNDPDLLSVRPYWKYIHNDTVTHPRPLHVSWSGLVLRHDDPWWKAHFPPNGWGCRCRVTAVNASEYQGAKAPDDGVYIKDDRFGNRHIIPNGIDYGWDYAPGSNTDTSLRELVQEKLIRYKPAISKALSRDINKYINAHDDIAGFVQKAIDNKTLDEVLWLGFSEAAEKIQAAVEVDTTGYLVTVSSKSINHVVNGHGNDSHGQRPPDPADYARLQEILTTGKLVAGTASYLGDKRVEATLVDGKNTFHAVFEIRPGKRSRSLTLVTLFINTKSR